MPQNIQHDTIQQTVYDGQRSPLYANIKAGNLHEKPKIFTVNMLNKTKSLIWNQTDLKYTISIDDSFIIKGIAICLMLVHHVFFEMHDYGEFVYILQRLGKVCVGMFLFLSAYGLTIQQDANKATHNLLLSPLDLTSFYIKRLLKLYSNYWFIFIISVPVGIFIFNRTLAIPYGDDNIIQNLLLDFFGMSGMKAYNITWWFYQLIITLYLFFPLLFIALKKWNIYILAICFSPFIYPLLLSSILPSFIYSIINGWLFHFALGISIALNRDRIHLFLKSFNRTRLLFFTVFTTVIAIMYRFSPGILSGTPMDSFLAPLFSLLTILTIRNLKGVNSVFHFLGKHSMNIFMIHTFIYYYYYTDFIYSFKHPVLIFTALLSISLTISIIIEVLKDKIGFNKLIKNLLRIKFFQATKHTA